LKYHCSAREILLRLKNGWQPEHLEELAGEKLIQIKKANPVVVLMTEQGMEKAKKSFTYFDMT
jgi:hypothetical protein